MLLRYALLCSLLLASVPALAQTWERIDPASAGLDATNQRGFAGIAAEGNRVLAAQRALTDSGVPTHRLFLSTDGGATWTQTADPGGGGQEDVEVIDGRLFTYSTANLIYYSDDDGASWTQATGFYAFGNGLYEFRLGMSASGGLIGSNGVGAYRSADNGATWTDLPPPTPNYATGLPARGRGSDAVETAAGTVLLSDFNAGIYRTTDGGATWQQTWTSPGFNQGILHLTLLTDGAVLAHVNTDPRSTLLSTDEGATWIPTDIVTLPAAALRGQGQGLIAWSGGDERRVTLLRGRTAEDLTGALGCVWQTAVTTTHLLATTRCPTTQENAEHGIYRRALGGTSTASETREERGAGALAVWPVPASGPSLTARLAASESGPVTIQLFDVLGREVSRRTIQLPAGHATDVTLDVDGYAPGLYVLRTSGAHRAVRTVVIGPGR